MTAVEEPFSPAVARPRGLTARIGTSGAVAWARANWMLLAVLLAFAVAAVVVPTMTPVATTDDWAYARSAQILLAEGRLTIFPVVAATAVFQVAWGALFGLLFGATLGVFRLATVVITALGGVALYGLCRELGVSRARSALGMAAFLFNPLVFVLAFTFMTDPYFAALLVMATWMFVRALDCGDAATPTKNLTPDPSPHPEGTRMGEGRRIALRRFIWQLISTSTHLLPSGHPLGAERAGVRVSAGARVSAEGIDARYLILGSAIASLAFLTRQQGALVVPAVVVFLLLTRRLWFDRASIILLAQLVALPLLTMAGYYLWLRYGYGAPQIQASFLREMLQEGWSGTWWLVRRLTVVELLYLGFFTLPLMAAALPYIEDLARALSRRGWLLCALWAAIAVGGVVTLWMRGMRMPYVAQFFGSGGLGPPDVLGSRPRLISADQRGALTIVCLVASLLLALVAARAMRNGPSNWEMRATQASPLQGGRAGLVLCIGLGQVIGVLPPSYHYIGWAAGSLDRYLLPLAPLAIALALWGLNGMRLALPAGWVIAAAMALFAIAGTRDYLVFMRDVWAMGERALAAGVPLERLDAGSGWDGYHLYEYGREHHVRSRTPKGGPWWVYFYAPATDSAYVVAGKPLPGYRVVVRRPSSSWLPGKAPTLYLLRRNGAPWPPNAAKSPMATATRTGVPLPPPPAASAGSSHATETDGKDD